MENGGLIGFRLSPLQKRLWMSQPDLQALRAQCALIVEGPLDIPSLQSSLQKVMDRHEILRTRFHRSAGMKVPFQVVGDKVQPDWRLANQKNCDPRDQEACIAEFCREESRHHFDFENGPLVRASLLALSEHKHVLLLSMPSLCGDARTLTLLVNELCSFYRGETPPATGEEQPLQYADFSEWHNQLLEGEENSGPGKNFWNRSELAQMSPLTLPFKAITVEEAGFVPDYLTSNIGPELLGKIEGLAQQHKTTTVSILFSCWQALLGRLAGEEEGVVGQVFEGRKLDELKGALGLFAKTLPNPIPGKNLSLVEILPLVAASTSAADHWQEFHDGEGFSGTTMREGEHCDFEFEPLSVTQVSNKVTFTVYQQFCHLNRFQVKLSCTVLENSCLLTFFYDAHLFHRDDMQRLAGYFERLLKNCINNPTAPIGSLDILDEEERRRLLVNFNETKTTYPSDKCLMQLFEEQVERVPDRIALVFEDRNWTYTELNRRSNQLAHFLRRHGVSRNVPVGLCFERSGEMIVGMLGILKAGGAYLPLHPEHPKSRLAFQLEETHAPVVVTQEKLLGQMPEGPGYFLCLDRDQGLLATESTANPDPLATPEDLAYVIYTSGSTGVPKGVAIRHRNLVNYTHFIQRKLGLAEKGQAECLHFATVSTLSADLGNTCIFPSLTSGGCLHVIGFDTAMAGRLLAEYQFRYPIDVLKITPSHLRALIAAEGAAVLPRRFLILGGETSTWELIRQVKDSGTRVVINHYGPTETTIGSLVFDFRDNPISIPMSATVPIGRPIANTEIYILDTFKNLVPLGTPGELFIGGAGVAQGYLNQADQTAERFVSHPFSPEPQGRLYKTGDRARYLPDGNVEFLGRLDTQVKIRGFRVEPAEIESVLHRHPEVKQAVVIAQDEPVGDKRLVAYVVPRHPGFAVEQLRGFLLERFPEYMVPSSLILLDKIPITANGKLDRRALPESDLAKISNKNDFVAPRNNVEEKLAAMWIEVLGVPQVGAFDDFFELGGHSLLATQLIWRIRNTFQVQLPLRSIFDTPTLAGLAETINQLLEGNSDNADLERMVAELAGLSEEEVQKLLAEES